MIKAMVKSVVGALFLVATTVAAASATYTSFNTATSDGTFDLGEAFSLSRDLSTASTGFRATNDFVVGSGVTAVRVELIDAGDLSGTLNVLFKDGSADPDNMPFTLSEGGTFLVDVDVGGTYSLAFSGFGGGTLGNVVVGLTAVPIPAAAWLFGSALLGMITVARRRGKFSVQDSPLTA